MIDFEVWYEDCYTLKNLKYKNEMRVDFGESII
jgi:hypothetical protein